MAIFQLFREQEFKKKTKISYAWELVCSVEIKTREQTMEPNNNEI